MPTDSDLYVSRYADVRARRWNGGRFERDGADDYGAAALIAWINDNGGQAWYEPRQSVSAGKPAFIIVRTNSGPAPVRAGWWAVRGGGTFRFEDRELIDFYPCDPGTFNRRWRTPPTFPESWSYVEAYRQRVRAATGCEFCGAAVGEPCTYYNDPSLQRGDLIPLPYIHDDRSAWYDVMIRTGQAAPAVTAAPTPKSEAPPNECHGGDVPHEFTPGVSEDDPGHPDPSWCNTCGEPRRPAP